MHDTVVRPAGKRRRREGDGVPHAVRRLSSRQARLKLFQNDTGASVGTRTRRWSGTHSTSSSSGSAMRDFCEALVEAVSIDSELFHADEGRLAAAAQLFEDAKRFAHLAPVSPADGHEWLETELHDLAAAPWRNAELA